MTNREAELAMKRHVEIGMKLYEVIEYRNEIKEHTVIRIDYNEQWGFVFYTDKYPTMTCYPTYLKYTYRYSRAKAMRVLYTLQEQRQRRVEREKAKEKLYAEYTLRNIKELEAYENAYEGRKILIKVEDDKWVESTVGTIFPLTTELGCAFKDTLRKNTYLFDREGKNWKIYKLSTILEDKIDKLKGEIVDLRKQLRRAKQDELVLKTQFKDWTDYEPLIDDEPEL